MAHSTQLSKNYEQLRAAFASLDLSLLEPLLADDVQFASCVGRAQVVEYLARMFDNGDVGTLAGFEVRGDRAIGRFELISNEEEKHPSRRSQFAVAFVSNDRVIELQVLDELDQALAAARTSPPSAAPQKLASLRSLAAVLPVRDLTRALEHYSQLGFTVSSYHDGGYGYAERNGVKLHLTLVQGLNPTTTTSAIYLYVDDADSLYAEWRAARISGQFFEPHDTGYGLREGAHTDRDGNLIRFGSPVGRESKEAAAAVEIAMLDEVVR